MTMLTGQPPAADGQAQVAPPAGAPAGNPITDWRSSLPEDLRNEKVFESIKGKDIAEAFPVLAKNYVHAQKLVGAEKLVIPGDTATPEEKANFYKKLGRPDTPDQYTPKLPEGLTEDKIDKARLDTWRKEMHEVGIPKGAAERLMEKYLGDEFARNQEAVISATKAQEANELAIKQEFGVKFDEKVNFARLALREFGSDQLSAILDQTGLGSHPEVVRLFASIGEKLSDDKARGGNGGNGSNPYATPEIAQSALNEFNRNAENMKALFDRSHINHSRVVEDRKKLFEAAYPSEVKT